ncbi:lipopolysaccharide biosynthesis protein [Microbacterium murale]|uniref:O-antigen/teichoic acid export membrane protein n=1 Tax=Microbacterium murale TaxID=1081040 RepID=A0ABU0PB72_9MICO|nr:oligosaccharide flippase family protein [Microbacterium murale]MDQ0644581.1 O-antigen/teichoic acid export membrane protein [Microbacterium murale]
MRERITRAFRKSLRSPSARHLLTLSSSNLIAQVITILGIPILSRVYGPTAFGFLAIYVSAATLVSLVATGRYEYAILLPKSRNNALALKSLARRLLWLVAILLEISMLVFLDSFAHFLDATEYKYWLLTLPLHVVLLGEISILSLWHTRHNGFSTLGRYRIIFSASTVVFQAVAGWLMLRDVRGLIIGLLVAQLIALVYLLSQQGISSIERKGISGQRVLVALRRYKKMPLLNAPTALLDGIRNTGINLVIGGQSQQALGQYSMAWRSVQAPVGLVGSALNQVYFQRMSHQDRGRLFSIVLSTTTRVALFTLPIFIVIFLLCPWFLPILLGESWADAGRYAQALVPWLFVNLVTSPIASVFVVTGTQGRQAIFGVAYTLAPILMLSMLRDDLLFAVWCTSILMAALLVGLLVLALFAARADDRRYLAGAANLKG